jgi:hypothetical protein
MKVGADYVSSSISLLHVEASRAMVSQSSLKTGVDVTTSGAPDIIIEITWS